MRLHFLQPLHGWRAFVGEIGVIVIGVLVALAAQKIVEDWNWRQLVAEETRALNEEIVGNHGSLLVRVMMQPCIDRRLAELSAVFRRHDAGAPVKLIGPIGRPTTFSGSKSALSMATTDQALAHMPLSQRQAIYATYASLDTFVPVATEERAGWRQLQPLDRVATLDRDDWREMRKAYDAVADTNTVMKANLSSYSNSTWLTPFRTYRLSMVQVADLRRSLLSLPYVHKLCRPVL